MSDPRGFKDKRTTPCGEQGHLFAIPSKVLDIANSMAKQMTENNSSLKIVRSESESILKERTTSQNNSEKGIDASKSYSSLGCQASPSSVFNLYTQFAQSRSCVVCPYGDDDSNDFPLVQPREEVI